jgi:hypothetical protein
MNFYSIRYHKSLTFKTLQFYNMVLKQNTKPAIASQELFKHVQKHPEVFES